MDEPASGSEVTPEELERERLITYVEWAEVRAPVWYWPLYAVLVGGWIASFGIDTRVGVGAAVVVVIAMALMVRAVTIRSGVSTPRLRGMPTALLRSFLPPTAVGLLSLATVVGAMATRDDPPYLLLGVVIGPLLALSGMWSSAWYRRAAVRVADEAGTERSGGTGNGRAGGECTDR